MKKASYFATLAQGSYTAAPDIGIESGAARIVKTKVGTNVVYAIPGTNNSQCELADVDAFPSIQKPYGAVHKGIWDAFDQIYHGVLTDAAFCKPKVICGHSEGAAGAIYLAARLCINNMAPLEVWAFEPPYQSIDSALAQVFQHYGVKVYIFRHGGDIVPLLPPPLTDPWRHCAPVIQFGEKSSIFPQIEDHLLKNIIPVLLGLENTPGNSLPVSQL